MQWRYEAQGEVVGLEEDGENDIARLLLWLEGPEADNTSIKIDVPKDTLKLRESVLVTIEPLIPKIAQIENRNHEHQN